MLDSFFQREDIPRPGWALAKIKEFCKKNKLKPVARWGKRGVPIKKDYEDCIKKYIEDTNECKYCAEEIMNSYGKRGKNHKQSNLKATKCLTW